MSDTPRVDAAAVSREFIAREMDHYAHKFVLADFARQLGRELAEAKRLLADIRADAQCAHWHKDIDAAMKGK